MQVSHGAFDACPRIRHHRVFRFARISGRPATGAMRTLDGLSRLAANSHIRQFCAGGTPLRPLIGVIACGAYVRSPGARE
jgi:hypothetical protein